MALSCGTAQNLQPTHVFRLCAVLSGQAYAGYESWWEMPAALRGMVDGVQICMWGAGAAQQLAGMRSHAPAMADRSWFPQAMRSYADFQKRYAAADAKLALLLRRLPPPPPPPPPPAPPAPPGSFVRQRGACRDAAGGWTSARVEQRNIAFSACRSKCEALGPRCDAFDVDGRVPTGEAEHLGRRRSRSGADVAPPSGAKPGDPVVAWCGVWGVGVTAADATPGWVFYCDGNCTPRGHHARVCRGDPAVGTNTCFIKAPVC